MVRYAGRRKQTEPRRHLESRIELRKAWHIGKRGRALLAGDCKCPQLAGLDMPRDGVAAESGRDLAGNECHGCRPTALERNVQQVDLRALLQHLHHEVMLAAVAYRAISEGRIGAPGV